MIKKKLIQKLKQLKRVVEFPHKPRSKGNEVWKKVKKKIK